MKLDKENKTITLSQKTGITLTIGAIVALILGGYAAGQMITNLEARIAAIEARAEWDAASASALSTKMETLQQGLNTTNNNVTRLSTQIEALMQHSGSTVRVAPTDSPRAVATQSPPTDEDSDDPPSPPSSSAPSDRALAELLERTPCTVLGLFCGRNEE